MMVVIRIKGLVGLDKKRGETLKRLRLRKKYSAVILQEKENIVGMIKKVGNCVAYGKIDEPTLYLLIEKRGKLVGNKPIKKEDIEKIVKELTSGKELKDIKIKDIEIKPFFRLHPPIGGFKKSTKKAFPKGVLGNQKEKINELLKRML